MTVATKRTTAAAEAFRPWAERPEETAPALRPAEFAVVVPTFNERDNLEELVDRIRDALGDTAWELVVVDDDSSDGTAELARALHAADPRVRILRRVGRRGLSTACIEGMLSSSARYLAVMDADLQHDPALLPEMLRRLRAGQADLVVASRYGPGGGVGDWAAKRLAISRLAVTIAQRAAGTRLTDPMSGFFALRREVVDEAAPGLSGRGFKILLDIVMTAPDLTVAELPYTFGVRKAGESKLSVSVGLMFLVMLAEKLFGRTLPAGFALAIAVVAGFLAVIAGVDARLVVAAATGALVGTACTRWTAALR